MSENQCQRIAVFIDGENVMPIYADYVFMYAEEQGTIVRKEIYGASIALNDWSDPIMKYAIHMNLTIRPTRFKNTSDIALTVGAMDLLTSHTVSMLASTILDGKPIAHAMQAIGFERIDSVIIVSSDSDFSVLSLRLRNAGINVIGMGEEKSNAMWKAACSSFVTLSLDKGCNSRLLPTQANMLQSASARLAKPKSAQYEEPSRDSDYPQQAVPFRQKEGVIRIAPTHMERVNVIRTFITAQLEEKGGKIRATELFALLNGLPDYQFDQQRSQRRPLDYLVRQYGDCFKFIQDADEVWLCSISSGEDCEKVENYSLLSDTVGKDGHVPEAEENAVDSNETIIYLKKMEINDENVEKIISICRSSTELKTIYNQLRSVFGASEGRRYYQMVKDHKGLFVQAETSNT